MDFSSKLLENAVQEIAQLPGIGRRTALRLALHLLKQPVEHTQSLAKALTSLREGIIFCDRCHNLSDAPTCEICSSPKRNKSILCVVEDIRDVMAIENTGQYNGLYHVLGGIISPMDGIGPQDLTINSLLEKVKNNEVSELIFALSATMEADTTNFYIYKLLKPFEIKTSTIARGIPVGDELEFTDEVTLGRSILARIPFEASISKS
ncbi:recombination mediator RecR [Flavobacteriaceae bacterium]|jgi:recombination protein RecR|nr:recombination protein RecR [Flavobacteriaceae bacterium]MDC1253218.1 recombination mediator RecR [bacterium]MBT4313730.1 recombination protein RecR [Flavobacteriaceae bacterium]MBT5091800.1 recombination protein RecR [Flavobacteriaceae bacterium]MBT5283330.1 recombination protein RecR [Flavobacteriaceae bacterium]|tara:strand:- start:33362 stop:33982 length:621 start_codon:yes stop_codon:yes gene_type:complete